MWTRQELKSRAKEALKRNYWGAVLAAFVNGLFVTGQASSSSRAVQEGQDELGEALNGLQPEVLIALFFILLGVIAVGWIISVVIKIFLANPIEVGVDRFFIQCERQEKVPVKELLFGFKNRYGNIVKSLFLRDLFIFLWSLLLVVPGIIKAFEWMMVPYIMAGQPDMLPSEAREFSKKLMDGHKWDAFVLILSFIGWQFLSGLTLGILGIFYVNPYMQMTIAEMYHTLRRGYVHNVR